MQLQLPHSLELLLLLQLLLSNSQKERKVKDTYPGNITKQLSLYLMEQ